jgi:hypothetical protein
MTVPDSAYEAFFEVYPPVSGMAHPVAADLADRIAREFGVAVPDSLCRFWSMLGAGSYGEGEILMFGETGTRSPGPDVIEWNKEDWWADAFPRPVDGGPFFFGCDAFGGQLGFRWESSVAIPVAFSATEMESYRLADDMDALFSDVLTERAALVDPDRFRAAITQLGMVPAGQCYVCDVSPLLTGHDDGPLHLESLKVHILTAMAEHAAIGKLPPGTDLSKVRFKVAWE